MNKALVIAACIAGSAALALAEPAPDQDRDDAPRSAIDLRVASDFNPLRPDPDRDAIRITVQWPDAPERIILVKIDYGPVPTQRTHPIIACDGFFIPLQGMIFGRAVSEAGQAVLSVPHQALMGSGRIRVHAFTRPHAAMRHMIDPSFTPDHARVLTPAQLGAHWRILSRHDENSAAPRYDPVLVLDRWDREYDAATDAAVCDLDLKAERTPADERR